MMPESAGDHDRANHALRRDALGVGAVTFFVVSAAGPLITMAAGAPVGMLLGNGAGLPAMFLIAVFILLVFAAGYTAMAQYVRHTGGFYAMVAHAFGGHAAGATAVIAIASYTAIQIGLYGLFGAATASMLEPLLHVHLAWWIYAFSALALTAILGYRSVELSAKVLSVLVIAEYLVVLVLDMAILLSPHTVISFVSFTPRVVASGAPWIGLLMCFTAFIGFEATTLYAEEAREPGRTIPIATYAALLLIGGFYVFSSWCMVLGVGPSQLMSTLRQSPDPTGLLFQLSDAQVGHVLTAIMRVLFVTSTFAGLLAFHNSISRYLYALGREGLLPGFLRYTHPIFAGPHLASCAQSSMAFIAVFCFVLAGADPVGVMFARVSAAGTLGVVALMAIASGAVLQFFRGKAGNRWRIQISPALATIALVAVFAFGWMRFDVLAGGYSPVVQWLPILVPLAALAGVLMVERLRRADRGKFARIGQLP